MKENSRDARLLIRLVSILILVGLIITVFVSVVTTETDKNDTKNRMNTILSYVKKQCVRYEEIASGETTKALYDLIDTAIEIREDQKLGENCTTEYLRDVVLKKRLTGLLVSDLTDSSKTLYYSNDGIKAEDWYSITQKFSNISANPNKSYSERYTGSDGYYYDYAMVARSDKKGAVLCYRRHRMDVVEGAQLSLETLLHGYSFERDGVIVVTDGTTVIASNFPEKEGTLAKQCSVVRKIRLFRERDTLIKVKEDDVYYGMRTSTQKYFIYAYLPESEVFTNRSLIMSYTLSLYLVFVVVLLIVRQRMLQIRHLEQEKQDEIYKKEKERLANDAIRANEVKTDFLRRMSHDIRTPINGIRGMVQIGEYYYDDPEKQKECREKIWGASGYLLDLVNDVLDMSKLQADEMEWKDEQFVFTDLLNEIMTLMSFQAKEHGITMSAQPWSITHDNLWGGKVQLKRIFMNLITNAIKYNKPNGSVLVSCRETGFKEGRASFRFVCADTGIGMDEQFVKIMYEPFSQEKRFHGKMSEGVGLGLSIVKKLVESAGGTISVDSKKGEGTSFTVDLSFETLDEENKLAPDLPSEPDGKKLAGCNVLVAEDNELNFEIVEFILKVEGANVIAATDGKQAVDIFAKSEEGSIDVILMDVMMPVMDGLTAVREIRTLSRVDATTVPIIAMTANAFADHVENAREAGMDAHVAKPIDGKKLVDCMLRLIKNKYRGGGKK